MEAKSVSFLAISQDLAERFGIAGYDWRSDARLAQRLDLGSRFGPTVGHDLLKDPHALLELRIACGILRGFLSGQARIDLELLLSKREEALGHIGDQTGDAANDDQQAKNVSDTHQAFPPLSIVS